MKGSSHSLIALATTSVMYSVDSRFIANPEKMLPFVFAYIGSLICDIDTGSSTISNILNPIKQKRTKRIAATIFVIISILGIICFKETQYLGIFIGGMVLLALSITKILQGIIRRTATILFALSILIIGIIYNQLPVILIGIFLSVLIFSPHRGYSHSIVSVAASLLLLKYVLRTYEIADYSVYFSLGLLSHIIADMFTEQGVMLLFPIQKKISFPITTKTGSNVEKIISIFASFIFILGIVTN